jgi:hypothetical protein
MTNESGGKPVLHKKHIARLQRESQLGERQLHRIIIYVFIGIVTTVALLVAYGAKVGDKQNTKLFGAISLGLPLGELAAKYTPSMTDEAGDEQRREDYTQMLQSSVNYLDITLDPPPVSLLKNGRGQQQYQSIESYFEQIKKQIDGRSPCIKFTAGLSLNSALLILGFHQVQNLDSEAIPLFKDDYLSRLDDFSSLSVASSLACKDEGFVDFSTKLHLVYTESLDWHDRVNQADNNDVAATVVSIGSTLADWLVDLSKVASSQSAP